MIWEVIIALIAGLLLGSFLSVLVERWHTKEGIVTGRSRCPACGHVLAWYDLVPLLSWALLRGRCRYCSASIHWRYPLKEVIMAVVLGGYVLRWGIPMGWQAVDLVILFGLVALLFFDARWMLLPDAFTFGLAGIVTVRILFAHPDKLIGAAATGIFLAAIFALLYFLTRGRGVGLGDAKFGLTIGLLFGFPEGFLVTAIAIWTAALVGVILLALRLATRRTPMPFGSFWAGVAVVALLWPEPLRAITSWLFFR